MFVAANQDLHEVVERLQAEIANNEGNCSDALAQEVDSRAEVLHRLLLFVYVFAFKTNQGESLSVLNVVQSWFFVNSYVNFLRGFVYRLASFDQEVLGKLKRPVLSFLLVIQVLEAAVLAQGTRHAGWSVGESTEKREKLI